MTYTKHGHHIAGSVMTEERPSSVARCGGPGLCSPCSREAATWAMKNEKKEEKVITENSQGDPQAKAKALVVAHANKRRDQSDKIQLDETMVYVVWFCYILGGWKALLSSVLPDDMYYEVTYNHQKKESYVDSYKKWENSTYPDQPEVVEEKA